MVLWDLVVPHYLMVLKVPWLLDCLVNHLVLDYPPDHQVLQDLLVQWVLVLQLNP